MNLGDGVACNIEGFSKVLSGAVWRFHSKFHRRQYVEMLKSSTVADNDCEKGSSI